MLCRLLKITRLKCYIHLEQKKSLIECITVDVFKFCETYLNNEWRANNLCTAYIWVRYHLHLEYKNHYIRM